MIIIAQLKNYWFYHGTNLVSGRKIIHEGFQISNKIGSLGTGAYAFANSYNDAKTFALRRCKYNRWNHETGDDIKPCVVKFQLKNPELILDFTNPLTILLYEKYTETYRDLLTDFISNHKNNKPGIKKLDGVVIDSFLRSRNKSNNLKFLGIYNLTQNDLYGLTIPHSQIPNSMELNLKSNKILNKSKLILDYNKN